MKIRYVLTLAFILNGINLIAQDIDHTADTLKSKRLSEIIITTYLKNSSTKFLPDISGVNIYAGKKTNSILLDNSRMNLAQNLTRMQDYRLM